MEGVLHRYMATVRAQETVTNADMSLVRDHDAASGTDADELSVSHT